MRRAFRLGTGAPAVDACRPRTRPGDEINTPRIILLDLLVWRDGWPRVDRGSPSSGPRPAPAR
jgi:arabinan endo-1,5-alpha-L-arabinosidase